MKGLGSIFLLAVMFLSFAGFASACQAVTAKPTITSLSSVSNFISQTTQNFFCGSTWTNNALNIIIYFIVPIIFLIVLLKAIMGELNIFTDKIQWVLAVCIAIMAIPAGVYSGLLSLMANIGGIFATIVFFVVVFVLGLSSWYTKKAKEFGFLMGNRFITILIVHSPLILLFTIVGIWLGSMKIGNNYLFQFAVSGVHLASWGMAPIYAIMAVIIGYAIFVLISKGARRNIKGFTVLTIVVLIVLTLVINMAHDIKAQSAVVGGVIGFMIGMGFALLKWGSQYDFDKKIKNVVQASGERQKEIAKAIKLLEKEKKELKEEHAELMKVRTFDAGTRKTQIMGRLRAIDREIENLQAASKNIDNDAEAAMGDSVVDEM